MEIIACPKCGSRRIFQGRLGEGVLTGYTSRDVCRDCGYQGMPIMFDSPKEYQKFLKAHKKDKPLKSDIQKEKTKKITQVKRPIGIIILALVMILEALLSIYFYYRFVGFDTTLWLWIYYIAIFSLSAIILPYGLIRGRGWAWTVGGVLFALSIPLGLIFLYYLTRPHVKEYFGKT